MNFKLNMGLVIMCIIIMCFHNSYVNGYKYCKVNAIHFYVTINDVDQS